jgi:formiminotetrahydrofolate cyclodeaminase
MQEALQGCTKTPFEMMELSLEALRLTDGLVDRSNASAASDLGCAALHLGSAVQGAWLNVLINLGSVRDAQYRTRGQILLDEALPLAQSIYDRVLKAVQG